MTAWINFGILLVALFFFASSYLKSLRVQHFTALFGEQGYMRCTQYRITSMLFMLILCICYLVYPHYPLPLPLDLPFYLSADSFPWSRSITLLASFLISFPFVFIWLNAVKAGGESLFFVNPNPPLFFWGPYRWIRHPLFLVELFFWASFSLFLDSPFLLAFSAIWIPLYIYIGLKEEKELIKEHGETYLSYRKAVGFFIPKSRKDLQGDMGERLSCSYEVESIFRIRDEADYQADSASDDEEEEEDPNIIDPNDHFHINENDA
ncbi:MAG: methyltransferase family protein [Alphaproteobacteria bacterium]